MPQKQLRQYQVTGVGCEHARSLVIFFKTKYSRLNVQTVF